MRALILAAGRGSRMKSSTKLRPKCLVKYNNKPLLEHQLHSIYDNNINNIGIVTGYLATQLNKYNLVEFHNKDWVATQMVFSLFHACHWLDNNEFIVSYSDLFYESNAIRVLKESLGDIVILYDPQWLKIWKTRFINPLDDAESFRIDSSKRITEIGKKALNICDIQGQFMGLIKFTPKGWYAFKKHYFAMDSDKRMRIDVTSFLSELIFNNIIEIIGMPFNGKWGEVDSESDIKAYNLIYQEN